MNDDMASVKERLLRSRQLARCELDVILGAEAPSPDFLHTHLRRYVLHRYLLDEACCPTDVINDIMLISLERALKIDRALISETEKGGACDRATPVVTKRILLFMTLQTELKTALPPEKLARTKTIRDLAEVIWEALEHNKLTQQ